MPDTTHHLISRQLAAVLLLAGCCAGPGRAAHLSELFQSGPAGQGIELTGIDPAQGATVAILNGSRFDTAGFGQVLEVLHLPPTAGGSPVVLMTDTAWPDTSVQATALADIDRLSSQSTIPLGPTTFDRLLVVFEGETGLLLGDNPVTNTDAQSRYDADTVTDWVAIGPGDLSSGYAASGLDLAAINTALGIDLLARTADRQSGQVIARAQLPGQALDLDALYVGDPDDTGHFDAGGGLFYRSTPGTANVPLVHPAPEPGSAAVLGVGGLCLARRRRGRRCSSAARGL